MAEWRCGCGQMFANAAPPRAVRTTGYCLGLAKFDLDPMGHRIRNPRGRRQVGLKVACSPVFSCLRLIREAQTWSSHLRCPTQAVPSRSMSRPPGQLERRSSASRNVDCEMSSQTHHHIIRDRAGSGLQANHITLTQRPLTCRQRPRAAANDIEVKRAPLLT